MRRGLLEKKKKMDQNLLLPNLAVTEIENENKKPLQLLAWQNPCPMMIYVYIARYIRTTILLRLSASYT